MREVAYALEGDYADVLKDVPEGSSLLPYFHAFLEPGLASARQETGRMQHSPERKSKEAT